MIDELLSVCEAIYEGESEQDRDVLRIKGGISRDVVTELDMKLHNALTQKALQIENCIVISEEGDANPHSLTAYKDLTVVIDPLDGSHNYQMGMPWYCTLVAIIKDKKFWQCGFYSPEHKQILSWKAVDNLDISKIQNQMAAPCYFAYPPNLTDSEQSFKNVLFKHIDAHSTGLYRWGSAGYGLYAVVERHLQSFVGIKIRVWDGLTFIPILHTMGCHVMYKIINQEQLILVCSWDDIFFKQITPLMQQQFGDFNTLDNSLELMING
jgi:fructose-1,6-bisphosphatase/inositol monophosphatase family enzyme